MNNPSPLVPQGSLLEQKSKSRSRFKAAIFSVLAAHGVILVALLMLQGCHKEEAPKDVSSTTPETNTNTAAADTNTIAGMPGDTNAPGTAAVPGMTGSNSTAPMPPTPTAPVATTVPTPPPEVPAAPTTTDYTVAKGDFPATIAKKNGISVKALMDANPGLDPKKLKIGQKLQLPVAGGGSSVSTTAGSSVAPTAEAPAAASGYTVKSGDTLGKIATAHKVTVKALRAANKLKTDKISVGQKLKIPAAKAAASAKASAPEPAAPSAPAPEPYSVPAPAPATAPAGRI
jgi:LysM repeat protein